jgi:hypothetical protein
MKDNKFIYGGLLVVILIHIFVLSKLIFFPYPELFIYPYLTNNGLLPYKQILDQHFPGLFFLPVNLNNLGMISPEIAKIWLFGIVAVTHLLIFWAGKNIFSKLRWVFLTNFLYLIWQPFFSGWALWIDSFLPLIVLPAFVLVKKYFDNKSNKTLILFGAGFLLGIGVVLKQVLIPLIALLGLFLIFKRASIKEILVYTAGVVINPILMIIYLLLINVWKDFWYWTVVYNLTIYSEFGRKSAPAFGFLTRVGLVFGSAIFLLFGKHKNNVSLLSIFLIGTLVCVYGRFDFIYFQTPLPFALLAFVYGLSNISNRYYKGFILVIYLLITIWWTSIFLKGHLGNDILSFDKQTLQIADKVTSLTKAKEKVFFLGTSPHLYQITDTLPAGDIFVFQFPWFYLVAEGRILDGIKSDPPNIVIIDDQAVIEGQTVKEFAPQVYAYLIENYQVIDQVGTARILIQNEK